MPEFPSAREVAERFLKAAVEGGLADLYTEDAVIEIPFAPEGWPDHFVGREEHRARFQRSAAVVRHERIEDVTIHETADPDVVILEFVMHSVLLDTSRPVERSFIMVVRVRDGLIAHSRDYSDPVATAELADAVRARRA
ncbi:nuclear transport factor 2 family protein [Nonomuraea sp. NPDC050783]|uniref:nuclear transport factor 2 family protein n=1 Tax=Nonomuraea sp. NPDC050783 TaxID=3154634 RepID=UPI0034653975